MAMEVVVRVPPGGDGGGGSSPSSSLYLSAPTSPSCDTFNFFPLLDDGDIAAPLGTPSAVPFYWEEKPGIPKSPNNFEFHFNIISASLSADDLFHDGMIKPLKLPPAFQLTMSSPRSPQNSKFSLRKKKSNIDLNIINDDPFEAALIKETHSHGTNFELQNSHKNRAKSRTDHKISYMSSDFARKSTRSLSPIGIPCETAPEGGGDGQNSLAGAEKSKSASFLSSISFSQANRRKLRGLFFRSASEKMAGDINVSSFRSADGGGSRLQFSTAKVSEEFMKKSCLLNKPGFLSRCFRLNRSGVPGISRGIGSLTRG